MNNTLVAPAATQPACTLAKRQLIQQRARPARPTTPDPPKHQRDRQLQGVMRDRPERHPGDCAKKQSFNLHVASKPDRHAKQ